MNRSARFGVALVLAAVLSGLARWSMAQGPPRPVPPMVISGADLGFRVEGQRGDAVTGRLVVRINGQWVEAQSASGVMKLGTQ